LIPISTSVPMLTIGCVLLAVGMGFNSPSMMSVISQLADPRWQGGTLGVSQALASLARIVGPAWGGWVYDRFGQEVPFVTAAGLMLIACAMSVMVFGRVRPTDEIARQHSLSDTATDPPAVS
jgi:DHA1 family tetracycline resistance protein-like MFS transporter